MVHMHSRRGPCCRLRVRSSSSTPSTPACVSAAVVELSPDDGGSPFCPNVATISFDRGVTVNSFTVVITGGVPFGNVPGGFVYNPVNFTATFTASPTLTCGLGGNGTATVVVDQGTACEQTIVWHYTIQAG